MTDKIFKVYFVGFFATFDIYDNFILDFIKKIGKVEITNEPDYLFYSVFNDDYLLYTDCIRIFFTGENLAPNFQLCDYAIGFERMSFGDRYIRFPFYFGMKEYADDLKAAINKDRSIPKEAFERRFCSFVYSNSDTDRAREDIFRVLNKYRSVDAGGRLFNSFNGHCVDDKYLFEFQHKFSIACENSSHLGYSTEKLMQAFAAQTIPIYYGDPSVIEEYNPAAFINCHEFRTYDQLLERVKEIDQNKKMYMDMLKQPTFVNDGFVEDIKQRFDRFISNIFTQDRPDAYRRNRYFWGEKMDKKYKKIYRVEKIVKYILRKT